jgi:hypothetical protein
MIELLLSAISSIKFLFQKRGARRAGQMSFAQIEEFYEYVKSTKRLPSNWAPAINNKSDIGPTRSTQK